MRTNLNFDQWWQRYALILALTEFRRVKKQNWETEYVCFTIRLYPGAFPLLCVWNRPEKQITINFEDALTKATLVWKEI